MILKYIALKIARIKAVNHYKRIIKWAKKQNPKVFASHKLMAKVLGENIYGYYCSYCNLLLTNCMRCPLAGQLAKSSLKNGSWTEECCNRLWQEMSDAPTWEQFIPRAEAVLQYIKDNG